MTEWLTVLAEMIGRQIWIAPLLCVAAGVITSFTPCSLSSVPMIIAYIGGSAGQDTRKAFRLSLTMAAGLALTFMVFGSLASVIGHYMHEIGKWWYLFLGILMALMALQIWGVIHLIPDHSAHHTHGKDCGCKTEENGEGSCGCGGHIPFTGKRGYAGAFVAGIFSGAFASHCATPVMIALLAIAARAGSMIWGIFLLALYAAGHSFLIVAAGTSYSMVEKWMYNPRYARVNALLRKVMGAVILLAGLAMVYLAFFY